MARINQTRGSKNLPATGQFNQKFAAPDISVKDLNSMIHLQGVRVRVYKTLWCPKRKSIDGVEHEISCSLCNGTEFLDIDPFETTAFIQAQQESQLVNPGDTGYNWEEQTVFSTFLSGVELSYYTKVELIDYTNQFKELVQRQPTGVAVISSFTPDSYTSSTGIVEIPDAVDLDLVRLNDIFIDSLGARFVVVGDIDNTTGAKEFKIAKDQSVSLLSGASITRPNVDRLKFRAHSVDAIIDKEGERYREDIDFVVDRNGDIEWLSDAGARKPADKLLYSTIYNTLVSYRAIRAQHTDRFGTLKTKRKQLEVAQYPEMWQMKKLFLFHKSDSESGEQLEANMIFAPGE